MGKLQSQFERSANTMMDNPGSLALIDAKVASLTIPAEFEGNPKEFQRRSKEGLQRLLGDEYMLSIQNKSGFNLKQTLDSLPKTETPTSLNYRAAVIENRVITEGEKPDSSRRLRNGTMDQQKKLEAFASALMEEQARTGTISADGVLKEAAKASYASGLNPADVANYAALTEGVSIPKEAVNSLASMQKPEEKKPEASGQSTAQPAAKAPAL
jgi:hypothetical protein